MASGGAASSAATNDLVGPLAAPDSLHFVNAPETGDVPALVKAEMTRAKADGGRVLVYVGATWCEPCQKFHHAVDHGELDGQLAKITFLAFDIDRDRERLDAANYSSKYIPLFTVPDANGMGTDKKMEGAIKGNGAVGQILPRLRTLLSDS